MRKILMTLAVTTLSCGTGSQTVIGPDGTPHHSISCRRTIENCYAEAASMCPNGYDIVDSGSDSRIVNVPNSGPVMVQRYRLLARCR